MKKFTFAVVDTETTGNPVKDGHRVIEIGAIKIRNLDIQDEKFESLINSGKKSDMVSELIHGIKLKDLEKAPSPDEVIPKFLDFISDCDFLIAHNAEFDKEFLENEINIVDPFSSLPPFLCTKKFSKFVYPHEGSHNLDAVMARANVIFEGNRHRALDDAIATAKAFLDLLQKSPIQEKDEIIKRIKE